jgi:hypothetical protein
MALNHSVQFASDLHLETVWLREILNSTNEVLKMPVPDTFLGRKTQCAFPEDKTTAQNGGLHEQR